MVFPPANADEAVAVPLARLQHASRRLLQAVVWARAVNEAWQTFNRHEARQAVADSPASPAAYVYERATLDTQIMMVARVFDRPGRGNILIQNRMSFPVCRELLALPRVIETLQDRSEDWNDLGPENRALLATRHHGFLERLAALEAEAPNRIELVRGFRDENIAHELRFDDLPPRPQYDHITGLVAEASTLVGDLAMIVDGSTVLWPEGDIGRSAAWLWEAVAENQRRQA